MKSLLNTIAITAIFAATINIASAQTATPPVKKPATGAHRRENQQDRIAQGVTSGQLTAGETAKLERRQARVNREVRAERKANGGTLTPAERKHVRRQQNRMSRKIYVDKHNAFKQ